MTEGNNGAVKLYQIVISFLLGVVLTGITAFVVAQKDVISRREFNEYQTRVDKRQDTFDAQLSTVLLLQQQNTVEIGKLLEDWKLYYPRREK